MKTKIQSLLLDLNQGLVEREQLLKAALLTVLAGENLVMIGPPGTGKSLVARRLACCLAMDSSETPGSDFFEYLLTKFSTPEEIFGPLSISELKADRFKRNTQGYLPTVKLAFLDEIFKASSSILNALLSILNERIFHNGAEAQQIPLRALIAASNELPAGQEELDALYDRFLVRIFVDYVKDENLHLLFETGPEFQLATDHQLTTSDLAQIHAAAAAVSIPAEIGNAIRQIWLAHKETFKEDRRESLSDRRLRKVLHLLRVSAATNGREAVDLSDVLLLKDCLWNDQENAEKVLQLILQTLTQFSSSIPVTALAQLAPLADGTTTYELAEDGVTLTAATIRANAQTKITVKGFKGSGTERDPLLIETIHDLADLARPEIGNMGYHFKQINNINLSEIQTWPKIVFQGEYNGNGCSLLCNTTIFLSVENSKIYDLIIHINPKIKDLATGIVGCLASDKVFLSNESKSSFISNYSSDGCLTQIASNCEYSFCHARGGISQQAHECTITNCQSNSVLFSEYAVKCVISNNIILFEDYSLRPIAISPKLKSCTIDNCFFSGTLNFENRHPFVSGFTFLTT